MDPSLSVVDMSSVEIGVGSIAPEFALKDQYGAPLSLRELRADRAVLLVFYPFAFSGICSGELQEIRDELGRFDNEVVHTVAISCDSVFSLRAWDDREAFFFPMLSDFWPHGRVARAYGVFDEGGGFARRGTFLVDAEGIVRWCLVNGPGERRDFQGFHEAVLTLAQ